MGRKDEIGMRGEAIFTVAIMRFCGRTRPYFASHFLGDKFQTLDFIVELLDAEQGSPYLFVQVKTTTQGYTTGKGPKKLKIRLEEEDAIRMRDYPAPTYLAGVDLIEERIFILSIDENTKTPRCRHADDVPVGLCELEGALGGSERILEIARHADDQLWLLCIGRNPWKQMHFPIWNSVLRPSRSSISRVGTSSSSRRTISIPASTCSSTSRGRGNRADARSA